MSSFTINYNSLRYGQSTRVPRVIQSFSHRIFSDAGKIAVSVALGITVKAMKQHTLRFDDDKDGRGLYPFVRISYANFKDNNGDGYKAVRHGLNQAEKLGIIKLHKPNYFTRTTKIEFVSFTHHFQNANSQVSKTQSSNITHEYITHSNNSTKHEYSTNTSTPKNLYKSVYANNAGNTDNGRKAKIQSKQEAKLNKQRQYENRISDQNTNYVAKRSDHLQESMCLPAQVTKAIAYTSGSSMNCFKELRGMLNNDKGWALDHFAKKINTKLYGTFSKAWASHALKFEQNSFFMRYKGKSFAGKLKYFCKAAFDKYGFDSSHAYGYINRSIQDYYIKAIENYTPVVNDPVYNKRMNGPKIPLDALDNDKSDNNSDNDLGDQHTKLHPTSVKLQNKIKKQLASLNSRD